MANKKKGLRVGKYRLMPLGIALLALLIVVVLVIGVTMIIDIVGKPAEDVETNQPVVLTTTATPTATPIVVVSTTPPVIVTPEPTVEPTPEPTATPEPELRSATVRSLGEIAVLEPILNAAKTDTSYDFVPMFRDIKHVVGNADLTIASVEGAMGGEGETGYFAKGAQLNTPPQLMLAMLDAGVDVLTLANDHALDTYWDGLLATIENCNKCGMDYVGVAATQEERDTPKIVEVNGINIGILNYTTTLNGMEEKSSSDANKFGVNTITNSNCVQDIQKAKDAGADVIVAYIAWGEMFEREIDRDQQEIATILANCGVDVIIGMNPHTVQPVGIIKGKLADDTEKDVLCLCATGNFLSSVGEKYYDSGIVFEFTIQEKEEGGFAIEAPTYIPTYVWRYEDADENVEYRVLPVGEYLEEKPLNMSEEDYARMLEVWDEVQGVMGSKVATVSAN